MATFTLTEEGAAFGTGFLNDVFLTLINGDGVTNVTESSAEVSWEIQPDEFDPTTETLTAVFGGTELNTDNGEVHSISFLYEGTELFTLVGLNIDFSNLVDAINDQDVDDLLDLFDGLPLQGDFSNAQGSMLFFGFGGDDTLTFGSGDDLIYLDGGSDVIDMGGGNDTVYLGLPSDTAAPGTTVVDGGAGDTDYVQLVSDGVDFFESGLTVKMNKLEFQIDGHKITLENFEAIVGTTFDDKIIGTNADETLDGYLGNNTLVGGGGVDYLAASEGKDKFVYNKASDSVFDEYDTIGYFQHGKDKIDISKIDADSKSGKFKFVGENDLKKVGDVHFYHHDDPEQDDPFSDYTVVEINVNKKGGPDMEIHILGLIDLTASDFVL